MYNKFHSFNNLKEQLLCRTLKSAFSSTDIEWHTLWYVYVICNMPISILSYHLHTHCVPSGTLCSHCLYTRCARKPELCWVL